MAHKSTAIRNITEAKLSEPLIELAVASAGEKKATQIVVLDLREVAQFSDFFIICSGRTGKQVQAICNEIEEKLLELGSKPLHIEGFQSAQWVLMDYGDFIVHIFDEEARKFYDLERLWRDATRIEILNG